MIGLTRIRCERVYRTDKLDYPGPDHRLFDVPPENAEEIKTYFEQRGWEVSLEQL